MDASRFIGRVGGLAVALGVGAAAFSGTAVAWADRSDAGSEATASAAPNAGSDSDTQTTRRHRAPDRTRGERGALADARQNSDATADSALEAAMMPVPVVALAQRPAIADHVPDGLVEVEATAVPLAGPAVEREVAGTVAPAAAVPAPVRAQQAAVTVLDPADIAMVATEPAGETAPVPAPAAAVAGFASQPDSGSKDGAGTYPGLPPGSPLEWGLLAVARRELFAGIPGLQTPAVGVTSSQPVTSRGITINPTSTLIDGVIQGSMNATSERGAELTFTAVSTYGKDGGRLDLGTVPASPTETDPQSYTVLPYGTWLDAGGTKGVQNFDVRIREVTDFDAFVVDLPLIGAIAAPVINLLQQLPLINDLLAPIIGSSIVATVGVDVGKLAPGGTPVAFTYKVPSFDGALIRTNFFPAAGLAEGATAPTALFGPGLGGAGATDPYGKTNSASFVPDVSVLRGSGYNVVTWDPRGEYDSGGILQLDNPFFEGRDASALVSWFAGNPLTRLDNPGDPAVGMVGGSYGGGVQWVTAGADPRIDAVVPGIAWYSLNQSLYPSDVFKTAWGNFLILALQLLPRLEGADGSRINDLIYQGVITGNLVNWVSETVQSFAASSGPTVLLNKLTAPALMVQGTVDSLFPLGQAVTNAQTILANPFGTPVKMIWFCGGHGYCADPINPDQQSNIYRDTIAWLDRYVADKPNPADVPNFQWYDQTGRYYSSNLLPFQPGFNKPDPYRTTAEGGTLGIIPVLGGSGSTGGQSVFPFPVNTLLGFQSTEAANALNFEVTPPVGTQIAGAPELSFTYTGLGTGKAVFAQLVDDKTGRVVGSIVTAVPVKLDGREHTVRIPLEQIAYTVYDPKDTLTLQIVASSTLYQNGSIGVINVSDVTLDLPVRA